MERDRNPPAKRQVSHKLAGDGPHLGPAGWTVLRFNLNVGWHYVGDLPECQRYSIFLGNIVTIDAPVSLHAT
jgi:hypothetical protein